MLSDIKIPQGVDYIGEAAFHFCESLKRVVISDDCEVAEGAFPENCEIIRR
jgi:hypothetical protein